MRSDFNVASTGESVAHDDFLARKKNFPKVVGRVLFETQRPQIIQVFEYDSPSTKQPHSESFSPAPKLGIMEGSAYADLRQLDFLKILIDAHKETQASEQQSLHKWFVREKRDSENHLLSFLDELVANLL